MFRIIGSRLLQHVSTARGLVITLIAMTYFSAMLITNDVALVTFVPFAIAVLIMANMEDKAVLVGALMTIGANVGSMLTPIGNAHNLYLKALTGMPASEMIGIMAPYSATAAVMLVIISCVVFGEQPVSEFQSLDGTRIEQGVLAPESGKHQPDEIRITGYGAGYGGWRTIVYTLLFVVCLLAVSGFVPLWAMCVIVVAAFLICRPASVFKIRGLGTAAHLLHVLHLHRQHEARARVLPAGALAGRRPSAGGGGRRPARSSAMCPPLILLSGFCDQWRDLIIGTNLGGMGTLIASMASLISYKNVVRQYPHKKGRYLAVYSAVNVLFLAVLLTLSWIIEPSF